MSGSTQQPAAKGDVAPCPLAELNAYIRQRRAARMGAPMPGEPPDPHELLAARRFRESFERGHALDRIEQALSRAPAQAGPLNSHALVLRTLDRLRELSPDYLRRLMAQAETLLWLERAREAYPRQAGKAKAKARKGRGRK